MNKIGLMYKTVKNMQAKKTLEGIFTAKGFKNDAPILNFSNQFKKELGSERTKFNMNMEMEADGKKMKHSVSSESDTPFKGCPWFGPHFHHAHGEFGMHRGFYGERHGRDMLSMLTLVLGVLDSVQIDESNENFYLASLTAKGVPDDLKKMFEEKIQHLHEMHQSEEKIQHLRNMHMEGHQHHGLPLKDFADLQDMDFELKIRISKDYELKSAEVFLTGTQKQDEEYKMRLSVNLNLA